jgi:hypothetical protein
MGADFQKAQQAMAALLASGMAEAVGLVDVATQRFVASVGSSLGEEIITLAMKSRREHHLIVGDFHETQRFVASESANYDFCAINDDYLLISRLSSNVSIGLFVLSRRPVARQLTALL